MTRGAEELCTRCGFCCDGTLFGSAPLRPSEVQTSQRLGLRVLPRDLPRDGGMHVLHQPCAALEDRRCRVYAERPEACRSYRCDLLNALAADEVSLEEAQAIVSRVRQSPDPEELLTFYFRGRRGR